MAAAPLKFPGLSEEGVLSCASSLVSMPKLVLGSGTSTSLSSAWSWSYGAIYNGDTAHNKLVYLTKTLRMLHDQKRTMYNGMTLCLITAWKPSDVGNTQSSSLQDINFPGFIAPRGYPCNPAYQSAENDLISCPCVHHNTYLWARPPTMLWTSWTYLSGNGIYKSTSSCL